MLASNLTEHSAALGDRRTARVAHTIRDFGRDAWNACFPGEIETFDYLAAVEYAGITGFSWRYVVVCDGPEIVAAMPAFLCDYALDTTLEAGLLSTIITSVRRVFPAFLKLRLACLGSPCTEAGVVGFNPCVPEDRQEEMFLRLLDAFEAHAASEGCGLAALKDLSLPLHPVVNQALSSRGYAGADGMATAWLDINFNSIDAYLAGLSSGTRKDMRRKLRMRDQVRIEYRRDLEGALDRVTALYRDTRARSEWQFEELTPEYFEGVLANMMGRSFCVLYYVGDELLAANLLVHDGHTLVDKFFCMDAERGRPYNLYYLSWFTNLEYCLRHDMRRYQSGQAYYANKVRLGGRLTSNLMLFRHRNRLIQSILRTAAPFFSVGNEREDAC